MWRALLLSAESGDVRRSREINLRALELVTGELLVSPRAQAVAAGTLSIPVATRLPLSQIRETHTLAEKKGAGRKIVLRTR